VGRSKPVLDLDRGDRLLSRTLVFQNAWMEIKEDLEGRTEMHQKKKRKGGIKTYPVNLVGKTRQGKGKGGSIRMVIFKIPLLMVGVRPRNRRGKRRSGGLGSGGVGRFFRSTGEGGGGPGTMGRWAFFGHR